MKFFLSILLTLFPVLALAAPGGGHAPGEVPTVVLYQLINLIILFSGIIYFTKDAIVSFFGGRKAAYLEAAQKSALAREQAEREFADIKYKLSQLEITRSESLEKAKAHGEEIKKTSLTEAGELSRRIRDDAALTAKLEVERAQKELRLQLLRDSMENARMVLTKDIGSSDQQKLQKDFISHVGV